MMIRCSIVFIILILTAPTTLAGGQLHGPIPAKVIRVVDGDTLKVRAKIWIGQTIDISVRLRGIDTPELSASCPLERQRAHQARQRLSTLVKGSSPVSLRHISQGKYGGRIIAFVDNANGISVGDVLLKENIARPYRRNNARKSWCNPLNVAVDKH